MILMKIKPKDIGRIVQYFAFKIGRTRSIELSEHMVLSDHEYMPAVLVQAAEWAIDTSSRRWIKDTKKRPSQDEMFLALMAAKKEQLCA